MPTLMKLKPPAEKTRKNDHVHRAIRHRIDGCPYRFVFNKVTWHYEYGRLALRGCVASFYLKQVIQELLRNIGEVEQIANHVDVVSATGLSSEPRKIPPQTEK